MDAVKGRRGAKANALSLFLPRKFFNFEKPRDALYSFARDPFNCRLEKRNGIFSRYLLFLSFCSNFFHSKIISRAHAIIVATRSKIGNKDDTCAIIRNRMR